MSAAERMGCNPEEAADLLRALAHPMRLRILCRLLDGELAVAGFESELGLKQPNLSQQLASLREAGLVTTRREAKSIVYRLADERVGRLLEALRLAMTGGAMPAPATPQPDTPPPVSPTQVPAVAPRVPPAQASTTRRGEAAVFAVTGWNLPESKGNRP